MNQDIKKAIIEEFAANDFRPRRRDDVVENVADRLKEPPPNVRAVFNTLVETGFIFRRGGWYVKAARPAPQPEPERPATPPPPPTVLTYSVDTSSDGASWIEQRTGLGSEAAARSFANEYIDNFAKYARVRCSDGAHSYRALPVSKREYDAWAGAHPVVGTEAHTLVNATSEALCREVVWRLATGRLPDACVGALAEVSYWAVQQGKKEA